MDRALGISLHTGWGACVVVEGSLQAPHVVANETIEILEDSERFCFHLAADLEYAAAEAWIARMRAKAVANARRAIAPLLSQGVNICAIVAKEGTAPALRDVLASHPRIHAAEGIFYRDALREACGITTRILSPKSLNPSEVGKCAPAPWGRDQKLAALAGWTVMKK